MPSSASVRSNPSETRHAVEMIDWNAELRTIEREYDGLPPEPSAAAMRSRRAAELRAREQAERRIALLGSGARLTLAGALLAGIPWWPYGTGCGPGLAGFLAAGGMIVLGGGWSAVHAWRHRLAVSHMIALAIVLAGLAIVSAQVLPRLGYATIAGVQASGWMCT